MNEELIKAHGIDLLDLVEETSRVYVWKAVQRTLDRSVFLVILKEEPARDPVETAYFLLVARQFAKLKSESLAAIFDIVSEENLHYVIMEYVEGESLDWVVTTNGPIKYNQVLQVATSICSCLKQLWENSRVIHRNIKGSTIRFDSRGIAKLMDFSLAIIDSPDFDPDVIDKEHVHGTPSFMSPEQASGELNYSMQSDMYALGALLYYIATGKTPFKGLAAEAILRQQIGGILTPPHHITAGLPVNFSRLLHKMMMKDPENRYRNWEELHHDLHCLMNGRQPICASTNVNFASTITPDFSKSEADNKTPAIKLKTRKRNQYLADIQDKHVIHHHKADEKVHLFKTQLSLWCILAVWLGALFWFRAVIQVNPEKKQQMLDKGKQIGTNPENLLPGKTIPKNTGAEPNNHNSAEKNKPIGTNSDKTEPAVLSLPVPAMLVTKLAHNFKNGNLSAAINIVSDQNIIFAGKQELMDILTNIPAAEALVSEHLRKNIGKPLVMNFKGKPRKVVPRKIRDKVVTLEANSRSIDFKIAKLSTEQKANWIDTPRTVEENIAYCLLLLQTWRSEEAANHADKCGILAPVIKKAATL